MEDLKRGRPKKYFTEEEKKEAKKIQNYKAIRVDDRRLYALKKYYEKRVLKENTNPNSIKCECGGNYTLSNLKAHKKSKRHIGFTNNID